MVLAGAGSGKTRTLTFRIANLIQSGIKPDNILAVTFTNKAAQEMTRRVHDLIRGNSLSSRPAKNQNLSYPAYKAAFPLIGTFHFFCLTVLRQDIEKLGFSRRFVIFDSNDQLSLIKKIIKDQGLSLDRLNPKAVLGAISSQKNNLTSPREHKKQIQSYFDEQTQSVYENYQKQLLSQNALDFDDIIMHTVTIWETHPEILKKYQDQYDYLLVDEYQDTNHAQYRLVNLLARKNKNIFVVGDDYQSIYAWRGANIKNILNFEKDYPGARTILLEQNYRSTQKILSAAQSVINKNLDQKPKNLWTKNNPGASIVAYEAANEQDEADFITQTITRELSASKNFNDFAVLYRINSQSRVLEEEFIKAGIPYRIVGGIKFYERAEIKDIIAYLRLILNPNDQLSLSRIINVPRRNLGKTTLEKLIAYSDAAQKNFSEIIELSLKNPQKSPFTKPKLNQLKNFLELTRKLTQKSKSLPLKDLISLAFKITGYRKMLQDGTEEGQARLENVLELLSLADKYQDQKPMPALQKFLEEVSLATSEENPGQEKQTVTLMTLHAAKGLEFKEVFMPGMEEGLLPHSRSRINPEEMEEERRLCYVGITRAMEKLWLIRTRNRRLFGQTTAGAASRFLKDIPPELMEEKISPPAFNQKIDYPKTDSEFWEEDSIDIES